MLYSRNTQYALRALTFLAERERGVVWPTHQIAKAERIAVPSLAKVMKELVRARMVRPGRGRKGGYMLAVDPRKVSLWHVMRRFDDPARLSGCAIGLKGCSDDSPCSLHPYWKKTRGVIERFLNRVHISDLVAAKRKAGVKGRAGFRYPKVPRLG